MAYNVSKARIEGHPPAPGLSLASSFPVGPRRCGVRRAHQIVNPALHRTKLHHTLIESIVFIARTVVLYSIHC